MIDRFKRNIHSFADLFLILRIFIWIHLIVIMLKISSLSKMLVLLTPASPPFLLASDRGALIGKVSKYTDFILGRNWWIYRMNCLKRALVIYGILRHYHINVQFCMGVRRSPLVEANDPAASLQGHAWLKINGKPFLEDGRSMTNTYVPVFSFPP